MPTLAYDLNSIAAYYYNGTATTDPYSIGATAYYNMGNYLGRRYYTSIDTSIGSPSQFFPSSSLGLESFYGTSPVNEWFVGGGGSGGK